MFGIICNHQNEWCRHKTPKTIILLKPLPHLNVTNRQVQTDSSYWNNLKKIIQTLINIWYKSLFIESSHWFLNSFFCRCMKGYDGERCGIQTLGTVKNEPTETNNAELVQTVLVVIAVVLSVISCTAILLMTCAQWVWNCHTAKHTKRNTTRHTIWWWGCSNQSIRFWLKDFKVNG